VFVRAKPRGEKTFYYLVKSQRVGNRVQQKTLAYLGEYPNIDAAIEDLPLRIKRIQEEAIRWYTKAEDAKQRVTPAHYSSAVALARARVIDGVPTFCWRGSRFRDDPAKQYWSHIEKARRYESWARSLMAQLEKLQKIKVSM
jgi:TPR repeat protein